MASLKAVKTVAAPFANAVEVVRVIYDFSVDGGQVEDNTVFTADGAVLVRCIGAYVLTGCTSGGSATIDLGKGTTGTEFLSASAVANFATAGNFVASASAAFLRLQNAEIINMGVATAALTAGKIEFIFEIAQA